jgi:hypothetical protein
MTSLEHDELLAKCEILKKDSVTRPSETNHRSEEEPKETEQGGEL